MPIKAPPKVKMRKYFGFLMTMRSDPPVFAKDRSLQAKRIDLRLAPRFTLKSQPRVLAKEAFAAVPEVLPTAFHPQRCYSYMW